MALKESDLGRLLEALHCVRSKWYMIGIQLRVNLGTLESVQRQPHGCDADRLATILIEWIKSTSDAAWQDIVDVLQLQTVGEQRLAEELRMSYCMRSDEHPVSDPALRDMKDKIAVFRKKFYDLFVDSWKELESKPVTELKAAIILLSGPEHQVFIESSLPNISNATSACEILGIISKPTDFITYGLLELLIQEYGTLRLKEKMKNYDQEFGEFARGAKMNLFMQAWGGIKGGPHETETSILCSRQEKNWWQYTLQHARDLHQQLCSESSLHPVIKSFLHFKHATNNCVTIQWLIPSKLVGVLETELKKMERVLSFNRLKILDLTLGGKCIYEAKFLTTSLFPNELPTLLSDLNSVCGKWRAIGIHLHVPLGELDNVASESISDNDRLRLLLEYWILSDRKPTWFVLLDVLRRPAIAEEEFANSLQTKYCLDPVEPLIESEIQSVMHTLEADFYELIQFLRVTMQEEPGGLQSLRISIGTAGESKPEIHQMVLALPGIAAADTVDKVLSDLYLHCDFLNCGLLQHMCKHLQNEIIQHKMNSYTKELEKLETSTLHVFMNLWRGIRRAPVHPSTLVSKQNKNWCYYTINDAVCVKKLICKIASIPSQLIWLESIEDSELVSVVWLMPRCIANLLKENKNLADKHGDKEFQQLAIDQLIVDGDPIYEAVADQMPSEAAEDVHVNKREPFLSLRKISALNAIVEDLDIAPEDLTKLQKICKRSCTTFQNLSKYKPSALRKKPSLPLEDTFRFLEEAFRFAANLRCKRMLEKRSKGLKLMPKDQQYSDSSQNILCDFSYAWTPFTESPSPDALDRWIELSERDVGFKHIRLENVSDNLKTRIEAAEESNAVALIVINDEDDHTLSQELVQCARKGSFPVVVITHRDGKKVKEVIVEHKSKAMTAMLQTAGEAPISTKKVVPHGSLKNDLKKLLIRTAGNSDAAPFEHAMALLDAYAKEGTGTTVRSKALEWILQEIRKPSHTDLPVYIGILGHVVLKYRKYGNKAGKFIEDFGWRMDKFLTKPSEVSEVIMDFLVRSDPLVVKRLNHDCYAVLKARCDNREIQNARREKQGFKRWFVPAAILWTTLTLKFHFQLNEFVDLCDGALWKQFLLRDPELLPLDMDFVDSIVHGLTLGGKLEIPIEASLMSHITVLLAPEDGLRQFTQLRYAIVKLSPFIKTPQSFKEVLKAVHKFHRSFFLRMGKTSYIGRTSKGGISSTITEGLEFVNAVLEVWKWGREEIEQICKEWLQLLLELIDLKGTGAPKLLHDIFRSEAVVVKEYKAIVVKQIQQEMKPENRFLPLLHFYQIYSVIGDELGTEFLEDFLEDYKLQKNDTISERIPTLNEFFSLVVERLPSKIHHHLLSFIMKFQEQYKNPAQYVLDLLKLDVQGKFEGSDDTTFKFVRELREILKDKHQSQEWLQEILKNLPQPGKIRKKGYFLEQIVWKTLIEELVPSVKDLSGEDTCCASQILEIAYQRVCDEPVGLSKPQEFCWEVIAYCCGLVYDKVKCKEFEWLTTYKYTVTIIGDIFNKIALPSPFSQLRSYEIYTKCVKEVQSFPKHWNQKLKLNDVTYDEILLYLEKFQDVCRIANHFNVTDFADRRIAEDSKEKFNEQFRLLSSYLVPFLKTHPEPTWCLLYVLLLEYRVNPPYDLFAEISELVQLPHLKECTPPWQNPEQFESTTNSLDSIPFLEKCGVQLAVSRNLTLKVMNTLVEKLKRFVGDVVGHFPILVGSCRSLLLKEYIKRAMTREPNSPPTIDLLKKALTATKSLVTKIINGNATVAEVTVNKMDALDDLIIDREFNILAACAGCQWPNSKPNILKRMLELFQLSSYIDSIERVCKRYELDRCSSDPTLRKLVDIAKDSSHKGCDPLTLKDIDDKYDDKYEQACSYLCLKGDQSVKCLRVFKKVNESADFHSFVEKKLFSGNQRGIPSPKQICRFLNLCDFISELHQDNQFAQVILGYVKVAFQYILPFMNKEQTFHDLMSDVTELTVASDFKELAHVTAFMDHIRGFFSITHDAWQSVSAQLQCISKSGTYSFRTRPNEPALHPVVILEYKTEESQPKVEWDSDQILDFVNRLGLVDTKTGGELEIQHFMTLYEIVHNLLKINIELRQLGHSDPTGVISSVSCSITEEGARVLSSKAENALRTWREEVKRLYQNHKWLLFFTPVKILEIYRAIQTDKSSRVAQEISFLFQYTTSTQSILDKAVKDTLSHQQQLQKYSQMELVGKFLTDLFASAVVDLSSIALPKHIQQYPQCGAFVHVGTGYNQNQLVRLILKIFHRVPAPYSMLSCCFSTTEEDLKLFMKRTQTFPGHYLILNVNRLSYRLQEVLLELYLQGAKQLKSRVDFIETSYSLFHEVPWIGTRTIHQDNGPSFSFEDAKACFQNSSEPKPFSTVTLVHGHPGVGKTHYIRQRLQRIQNDHKVTIAVNEAFQRSAAIKKLNILRPKASSCAVFFNFTLAPPTGQIQDSEMEHYNELMDDIGWFLFELLVLGYVYDSATAKSFHIPGGCKWVAYVEVPSWMHLDELIENKIPALGLVGTPRRIESSAPYCVDDDVQLLCSYFKAYESGEINTLVFEDLPAATVIHDLHPDLADEHLLKKLNKWGVPSGGDPPVRSMILELYKAGLLKKLCVRGSKVTFKPDEHSCLAKHECRNLLDACMPDCVKNNKIAQKLFVKYMKRRCDFLENFPGFCYNTGVGERKLNTGAAGKRNEYTNTVLLGSTLFKTMLEEVENFCDPSLKTDWSHQPHQQLIYDMKNYSGSIGIICFEPHELSASTRDAITRIGVEIPTERLENIIEMKKRMKLDEYLSRALNIRLDNERLRLIDEDYYVLTLDYTLKMLNIHERFKCGVPVIIEGETGVGKTKLVEMLSKLWNQSFSEELSCIKEHIFEQLKAAVKEDGNYTEFEDAIRRIATVTLESQPAIDHLNSLDISEIITEMKCINDIPSHKRAFYSVLKPELQKLRLSPIMHLLWVKNTSEVQGNTKPLDSIRHEHLEILFKRAEDEKDILATSLLFQILLTVEFPDFFHKLFIDATLKPVDVRKFFLRVSTQATQLKDVYEKLHNHHHSRAQPHEDHLASVPNVTAYFDEVNTSSCLGLFKEIIVDRTIDGEPIPDNIFIIASCNPHRGNSLAMRGAKTHYYVRQLHPTLHLLKWDYGSLNPLQEEEYIKEKLVLLKKSKQHMVQSMSDNQVACLTKLISWSQVVIRKYAAEEMKKNLVDEEEAELRAKSCVSQRDIQRVFTLFEWLLQMYEYSRLNSSSPDECWYRAMLVATGIVYYLRLNSNDRQRYEKELNTQAKTYESPITFSKAFQYELDWMIESVDLPKGIAKTLALKENLFAVIVCCVTKTPLIIEGAPGCSKTLSFHVAVSNLNGKVSEKPIFQHTTVFPSLAPYFYQCSRSTTSNEIRSVFHRAISRHKTNTVTSNEECSVVFMDEVGLPEEELESLKALHHFLDTPEVSFVAITNSPLDAAKTNRGVSVYRPEANDNDLEELATERLSHDQEETYDIKGICNAYRHIMKMQEDQHEEFFGLRDFMYFLIHIRRYHETPGAQAILNALERNFNGKKPEQFKELSAEFLKKVDSQSQQVTYHSTLTILKESLNDQAFSSEPSDQFSIQSDIRFKMIIDSSEDGSLLRLLFSFKVLDRENTRVYVCSNFPGDKHLQVNTIAQIRRSAAKGETIVMCQTDRVNDSFYDFFNQRFRCIDDHDHGTLYFANVAIGAHSLLTQVDPKFQCVLVVKESEVKARITTPALLNRFEKYRLSHEIMWEKALGYLKPGIRMMMNMVCHKVMQFVEYLDSSSFYGLLPNSTVYSVMISMVELPGQRRTQESTITRLTTSKEALSLHNLLEFFQKKSGLRIPQVLDDELEADARSIFEILRDGRWFEDCLEDFDTDYEDVEEAVNILVDSEDPMKSRKFCHIKSCIVISILLNWLIRQACKRLMRIMTPEALAVQNRKIPRSYIQCYLQFQSHFSLKDLLIRQCTMLRREMRTTATKLLCYTRSSPIIDQKLPPEYPSTLSQICDTDIKHLVYEQPNKVMVYKITASTSLGRMELLLQQFIKRQELEIFLLIAGLPEISQDVVNHVRILLEEKSCDFTCSPFKIFVLLLHFTPVMFFNVCYNSLILEDWEHYYMDSIVHGNVRETTSLIIDVKHWFRQCCLQEVTMFKPMIDYLQQLIPEAIPVISSCIELHEKDGIMKMNALQTKKAIEALLIKKGIGKLLCEQFERKWDQHTMVEYMQKAASYAYNHTFSLNLVDSLQTMVNSLFVDYLVCMVRRMNEDCTIDILLKGECPDASHFFKKIIKAVDVIKVPDLKAHSSSRLSSSLCPSCFKFPFFRSVFLATEKFVAKCREEFEVRQPQRGIHNQITSRKEETEQYVCEVAVSNFPIYKSEGKVFIKEAADFIQSDAQNILWSTYLDDFLHHRLLPKDHTLSGSEDLSLEILKRYFEPLNYEPDIVCRLVSLHIHVHMHQLDGVQLISILDILTRTCGTPSIQQASSSYMVSVSKHSLLKSVPPMQTPEKLSNSYQCLASFVITVLFASLQRILHKQTSAPITGSQEWFSSYLNLVSSSVIKENLYSSLSEEDLAKLTILHCTFLAMQCSQENQFVRAQQIFSLLHPICFTGQEVLKLKGRLPLREVAAIGAKATSTSSKMLTGYMEGVLEYFFSINNSHNTDDYKWFLELANKPFGPKSAVSLSEVTFDDQQVVHDCLSLGTYKYFLSRLLFAFTSDSDSRQQLVHVQFVKTVRRTVGNILTADLQDTPLGPYIPPLYQLQQISQNFCVPRTTPVLQQQLAHLYFMVWFEQLQNVKPNKLDLNMLASQGSRISESLSGENLDASERSLLLIEKEVVTQAILFKLAEDRKGISKVHNISTLKAFLSDSPLAAANGLMLATQVMKRIRLSAMKELLEDQNHPLNCELTCLEPVQTFMRNSESEADHLFGNLDSLSLPLPDEKDFTEILQVKNSSPEVPVLSKFAHEYPQLQSGGSLLPKLVKFYQVLHRDLAYTLSQEEVEDMTLLQLLEKMDKLCPGVVHFDPFEHNEYVDTVMGDSTYSLLDSTKVMQLLSVGNESGCLLDVIKHIVDHHNQFLTYMERLIEDQQLQFFIPEFSKIPLARVDEHTCLTGGGKSVDGTVSEYLLLIQRRWKVTELPCINGYSTDLLALQRDVAVRFLSGKCKISNPDEILTAFKFRETSLKKEKFHFPTNMEKLDQETVRNNLPLDFQESLEHQQLQKLKFEFHSSDFHKMLEVETGLKICAYFLTQYLQSSEQKTKMSTLSQFLGYIYPKLSLRSCFEETRLESLSETQLTTLGDVKLPNLYAVLVQFIEWIKDGFHEFYKLPLLLKEEMRREDSEIVRGFCLRTDTSSHMAHFEKDMLMIIQPDLEGQMKYATSVSQNSITTYLKANNLLDPRKEDDKWLLTSLPEQILVQHYVHLRILIRQNLHNFKQSLFEGEQSRWKEGVMELWQSDRFLIHLSEQSYAPTGEFTYDPQSSIPYGFMDQHEDADKHEESSISDSFVDVPEPQVLPAHMGDIVKPKQEAVPLVPTVQEGAMYTQQLDEKQMADKCDEDGVRKFLQSIKCSQYIQNFKNEEIDGSMLHDILAGDEADNTLKGWLGIKSPIDVVRIKTKFPKYLHANFSI